MKNKILTIVMPAYNMEKYLSRSLESILINEIIEDIEILIVNDGSKDKTLSIALDYQEQYPNTIHVIDKENGNYGSTINKAIEAATGKYIKTLDSDDWYNSEEFVKYIDALKECDEDLIINGYSYFYESVKRIIPVFTYKEKYWNETIDISKRDLYQLKLDYQLNMPAMTFKTSVVRGSGFKLHEKTYYTDTEYVYYPFKKTRTIKLLPFNVYVYYIGRNEQSVSPENILKNFDSKYRIIKKMTLDYLNEKNSELLINKKFMLQKNMGGLYHYLYLSNEHNSEIDEIDNIIKEQDITLYNELEEKINTYGVKYLKMHRQGLDFDHIKTHIEKAKKRKNSILNRLFRKIANKIKAL